MPLVNIRQQRMVTIGKRGVGALAHNLVRLKLHLIDRQGKHLRRRLQNDHRKVLRDYVITLLL